MERVNGATALCFSRGLFPPSLSSQEGDMASRGGWIAGRIEGGSITLVEEHQSFLKGLRLRGVEKPGGDTTIDGFCVSIC